MHEIIKLSQKYPKSNLVDHMKAIHQSVFAGGHLITNPTESFQKLQEEVSCLSWSSLPTEPLYEPISEDFVRVHLRPYTYHGCSLESLHHAFALSASATNGSMDLFVKKLHQLADMANNHQIFESKEEVETFLASYKNQGFPLLSHSDMYRKEYRPSYRVIHRRFLTEPMKYYQLKHFILQKSLSKPFVLIAIDGKCGSGKTTLSRLLQEEFNLTVLPMDDFFLSNEMKTKERLSLPGGNIHHELLKTVLPTMTVGKPLIYPAYDCQTGLATQKTISLVAPIVLIEGTYSLHEELRSFYDGMVYIDIDPATQLQRLTARTSKPILNRFIYEWIPLENQYFFECSIASIADIIV